MGDWQDGYDMGLWGEDGILNCSEEKSNYHSKEYGDSRPDCPRCSKRMIKRLAKQGKHKGNYFWGCSRYPRCKGIINIPVFQQKVDNKSIKKNIITDKIKDTDINKLTREEVIEKFIKKEIGNKELKEYIAKESEKSLEELESSLKDGIITWGPRVALAIITGGIFGI